MNTTTLSDLWDTRPVRKREGHKVAGVCSGIGARYNVDPTLIRVAFVVAAIFGGAGVLAYLVAVVAFPRQRSAETDGTNDRRPMSLGRLILLGVIAIVVVSSFGGDNMWSGGGIAGTALLLLGWWLLYQRTPVPPAGTAVDQEPMPASVADAEQAEGAVPETAAVAGGAAGASAGPPAWDPLGVAPFAWDLPEPTPVAPPPAPKPPSSPITPITTGLAVLVAVAGSAASLAGVEWFTVGRIASLSLAVIGLGLLFAAFVPRPEGARSSGLTPLGFLVAAIVVVSTLVDASGWSPAPGGIGERKYQVSEQSELQDEYGLTVGSTALDLRELDMLDADKTVRLGQSVGEITVQLPQNVRVRAVCSVTIGNFDCPPGIVGGSDEGPILTIEAHVGMGNVEMKR